MRTKANICMECQFPNRMGELFCIDCGNPLFAVTKDEEARSTKQLKIIPPQLTHTPIWGTTHLAQEGSLVFRVKNHTDPLVLQPKDEMVVGRADLKSNHYPAIDLTPYGALEEGISRVHAKLNRDGETVTVTDMNSVNGTYLNGQRLPAHQARVVRDGDEVRFGRLIMNIYFK